ncbi:DUF2798 domain-containing protein [Rhizobium leguminosarum]
MNDRKSLLFAQLLITLLMAASMSGIMSMIALSPTLEWLHAWPLPFIIAWPIAFVLTLFVSRIAFGIASHVFSKRPA